jgi:hypothetical protein
MVYNTQNHLAFRLYPSSGILETREHNVSETGSFRPQMRAKRRLLSWVSLKEYVFPPPSPEDGNRFSFRNVVFPM